MKTGYVSIVGKTNSGKSTLLNSLLKTKVSIVSPKVQTTRDNILGILNNDQGQIIFVDTPGLHKTKNRLDKHMIKSSRGAESGSDIVLYLIDAQDRRKDEELESLQRLAENHSVIAVVSKTDLVTFEKLYPFLSRLNEVQGLVDIIPISAVKRRNLDVLIEKIMSLLPEGNPIFGPMEYTDKPVTFLVSEIVREKALYLLEDELPHGIAVVVTEFSDFGKKTEISADIICEKASHKSIIIGKGGSMIKNIGQRARSELEKILGTHININLFVKVEEDWRNKPQRLKDYGYND